MVAEGLSPEAKALELRFASVVVPNERAFSQLARVART
jgi:hypothetical protein